MDAPPPDPPGGGAPVTPSVILCRMARPSASRDSTGMERMRFLSVLWSSMARLAEGRSAGRSGVERTSLSWSRRESRSRARDAKLSSSCGGEERGGYSQLVKLSNSCDREERDEHSQLVKLSSSCGREEREEYSQ